MFGWFFSPSSLPACFPELPGHRILLLSLSLCWRFLISLLCWFLQTSWGAWGSGLALLLLSICTARGAHTVLGLQHHLYLDGSHVCPSSQMFLLIPDINFWNFSYIISPYINPCPIYGHPIQCPPLEGQTPMTKS